MLQKDVNEIVSKIEYEQSVCNSGMIRNELDYLKAWIKGRHINNDNDPTVHSRWMHIKKANIAVCMNCKFERDLSADFGKAIACPNCGAIMDFKDD